LDSEEYPLDTDNDGIENKIDDDDDGDGILDTTENSCLTDPLNPDSIPTDFDNDGICDYSDIDDDGDGAADELDAFPFDPTEYSDIDSDGIGNNADDDDDGDGWTDYQENNCISNSQDPNSVPVDSDNDGICDQMESEGTSGLPGFGLISAITMLAFAAFARKE